MAQRATAGRRYLRAFVSGFFIAVPVTVTVLDRFAYLARVEGASMQPTASHLYEHDLLVFPVCFMYVYCPLRSPRNPQQKIIKRVIGLEGDFIRTLSYKNRYVRVPDGHFWIEGDHHGHSLDSNSFGPVSVGLLHGRASHIIWPPNRWQRIRASLPANRGPLDTEEDEG
uniref:Mitochondrial inner membrane protease subunit 2 n=1 Tax=Monopterus albus TaxID=43700 RepID=A0A3Q3JR90_MONAL